MLSCAVLLLLLVAVLGRGRRCSIAQILRQYRAVIFHELQNLVSRGRALPGDPALALGVLLGWRQPCCGMWGGKLNMELAALPAVLRRGLCLNGGSLLQGSHRSCEVLDPLALFLQRNLTGSVYRSGRAGPACRSDKVSTEGPGAGAWRGLSPQGAPEPPSLLCASPLQDQKILLSIYNISMSLQEVGAGTLQGPEELAVWRVARNTNFVFRENCRKISKVGYPLLPSHVSGSQFPGLWAVLALFCPLLAAHEESPGSACFILGAGEC